MKALTLYQSSFVLFFIVFIIINRDLGFCKLFIFCSWVSNKTKVRDLICFFFSFLGFDLLLKVVVVDFVKISWNFNVEGLWIWNFRSD